VQLSKEDAPSPIWPSLLANNGVELAPFQPADLSGIGNTGNTAAGYNPQLGSSGAVAWAAQA